MTTEQRLDYHDEAIAELRGSLARLEAKVDANFRWLVGIMITMWVTTVLTIVGTGVGAIVALN